MKKKGIYGYWDTKKECVIYIGKDSNISINSRHKAHYTPSKYDDQQINRILQNNKGRYTYFILCDGYFTEKELNELEKEAIAIFNTYYGYGFNFTKGGDGISVKKEDHHFYGKHHTESSRKKTSKTMNTTGFYRVCKYNKSRVTQGFVWSYKYYIDGKPKYIERVCLNDLETIVRDKNLDWFIIDEKKAQKNLKKEVGKDAINTGVYRIHQKHTLWDASCVKYFKSAMVKNNSQNNPRKCFALKFNNKLIKMGINFFDFTSIEIIDNLIKEAI